MKKTICFLLVLAFGVTACDKKSTKEQLPDPASENTITRSFNYPNRGTTVTKTYGTTDIVATANRYSEGMTLYFNVGHKLNGTDGDGIAFMLNKSIFSDSYVGVYDINVSSSIMMRYIYSYVSTNGVSWANLLNSWDDVKFEGQLIIDKYDKSRNLINGTYVVSIKDLDYDPAKQDNGPADPNDKCDVTLKGSFDNLKIKTN